MFVLPRAQTLNFSNTPNLANGLNKTSANELGLYTNNIDRLHITNIGKVGIGTTTPDSQLHIIGDLHVSTTSLFDGNVTMGGTLTLSGDTTLEDATVNNDLLVRGTLTVQGSTVTIDSETLTVDDSMIRLADNNPDDLIDIGFYGMYVDTGVTKYRGLIHDASVDQWTLFNDETNEPISSLSLTNNPIMAATNNGIALGITGQLVNDTNGIRLHIHKNNTTGNNIQFTNETTGVESTRGFRIGLTSLEEGQVWLYENKSLKFGTNNSESMRITEDGSLKVLDNQLRVDSGGNVGIGTVSPSAKLDVAGDIYPNADGVYDLGVTTKRWKDLYLSGTSINLGGSIISNDANSFEVETNGSERIRIDSSGNVGIGTGNPLELLHINKSQTGNTRLQISNNDNTVGNTSGLAFASGSNISSLTGLIESEKTGATNDFAMKFYTFGGSLDEQMIIDKDGNVGIGVTNPSLPLEVQGTMRLRENNTTSEGGELRFFMSDGVNDWKIDTQGTSISQQKLRFFNSHLSGGIILTTTGQMGLSQGGLFDPTIDFSIGDDNTGLNHSASDTLELYTGGNERLRVDSSGNVGIGTNNPESKLHVEGSEATGHGNNAAIQIENTASGGDSWYLRAGATGTNTPAGGFSIADTSAYRLAIDGSGNVGIGTTSPGETLHVNGGIKFGAPIYSLKKTFSFVPSTTTTIYTQYLGTFNVEGVVEIFLRDSGNNHGSGSYFKVTRDFGDTPIVMQGYDGLGAGTANYSIHYRNTTSSEYELFFKNNTGNTNTIGFTVWIQYTGNSFSDSLSASNDTSVAECNYGIIVEENGLVGIGTNNPSAQLHIYEPSAFCELKIESDGGGALLSLDRQATSNEATIDFKTAGTLNWLIGMDNSPSGSASDFIIKQTDNGSGIDGLIIKTSGNVGMGSTLPGNRLVVAEDSGGTTPQLLVEPQATTGEDSSIEIRGARNASTTNDHANLILSNYDDDLSATNKLGKITGLVTNSTTNVGDLVFYNFSDGSTQGETMRLTSAGRVGIGSTDPTGTLTIVNSAGDESSGETSTNHALRITTGTSSQSIWMGYDGTDDIGYINVAKSGSTQPLCLQTRGNNVGIGTTNPNFDLHLYDTTATWFQITNDTTGHTSSNGSIMGFSSGSSVLEIRNRNNDAMVFSTNDNERVRINSSGDVGIGTNTPATKFHVYTTPSSDQDIALFMSPNLSNTTNRLKIGQSNTNGNTAELNFTYVSSDSSSNRLDIGFHSQDVMSLLNSGNVGIGTNNPQTPLQVFTRSSVTLYDSSTISDVAAIFGAMLGNAFDTNIMVMDGRTTASGSTGGIIFGNYDDNLGTGNERGVAGKVGQHWDAAQISSGGGLTFYTSTNGLTLTSNMTLSSAGALSKTSGSFDIPHPKPEMKEQNYRLRHHFVESPNEGDNIYRYEVEATENNQVINIDLPDYFPYLNKNPQIWVNASEHFGRGFGKLNEENNMLEVHCETPGKYNVLLIGTRKDEGAIQAYQQKGLIWKSSDGTMGGQVEEILLI